MQSAFVPDAAVHALVCSTCGAPLSAQKQRPLAEHKGAKLASKPMKSNPKKPKPPKQGDWRGQLADRATDKLRKKKKKSKRAPWKKALGEVFDIFEEIFD